MHENKDAWEVLLPTIGTAHIHLHSTLEQFETRLYKRQKDSQSLAHAQVLSGEKMMGHRHGLTPGIGPSHGPLMRSYPHVPPQPIPFSHPPPVPPARCSETTTQGVGRGGKGEVKTCRACAKHGHHGLRFTNRHKGECAYAKMGKQSRRTSAERALCEVLVFVSVPYLNVCGILFYVSPRQC